jgi:O-antigen ligase
MRYLLAGLLLFLMAAEVFSWDVSMGPGLSIKNAVLYLIAMFLIFRIAVSRGERLDAGPIHLGFVILIAYALVTWLTAGLIIEYPGYDLIASGIRLKSELIDHFIFFLVFYYGVTSRRDALTVLQGLLVAALFANLMTVADTLGYIDLGFQERESGRVEGALGEANQYAAYIILFLPGMIAAVMQSRGLWRIFWLGAVVFSAVALVMTVSRGAFVGLLAAAVAGGWLYRHRLSLGKVTAWLFAAVIVVTVSLSLSQYTALIEERLFTQTGAIDMSDASSGRVDIWRALLERMMATPITFITGFGWDVYWTMPFRYSPHNHYLNLWFNLGLPGLLAGIGLLVSAMWLGKRASEDADPELRPRLIAFVVGVLGVAAAVFFVDLHRPWYYFWAYAGVAMRLAVTVANESRARAEVHGALPAVAREPSAASQPDPYGWVGRPPAAGELRSHGAHR